MYLGQKSPNSIVNQKKGPPVFKMFHFNPSKEKKKKQKNIMTTVTTTDPRKVQHYSASYPHSRKVAENVQRYK